MRPLYYKVDGRGRISPCDMFEANKQLASHTGRCVGFERLGACSVSTAFLVFDHAPFSPEPVLWDTRVYAPDGSFTVAGRYGSLHEAEAGHRAVVATIRLVG